MSEEAVATADEIERDGIDAAQEHMDEGTFGRLASPRTIVFIVLGIVVAIVGLYVLLPKLVGVSEAFTKIGDAKWYWIVASVGFVLVAFGAYTLVFKVVVGGDRSLFGHVVSGPSSRRPSATGLISGATRGAIKRTASASAAPATRSVT